MMLLLIYLCNKLVVVAGIAFVYRVSFSHANHTYFVIRVYVESWRDEINDNIIRVVKYE